MVPSCWWAIVTLLLEVTIDFRCLFIGTLYHVICRVWTKTSTLNILRIIESKRRFNPELPYVVLAMVPELWIAQSLAPLILRSSLVAPFIWLMSSKVWPIFQVTVCNLSTFIIFLCCVIFQIKLRYSIGTKFWRNLTIFMNRLALKKLLSFQKLFDFKEVRTLIVFFKVVTNIFHFLKLDIAVLFWCLHICNLCKFLLKDRTRRISLTFFNLVLIILNGPKCCWGAYVKVKIDALILSQRLFKKFDVLIVSKLNLVLNSNRFFNLLICIKEHIPGGGRLQLLLIFKFVDFFSEAFGFVSDWLRMMCFGHLKNIF